MKDLLISILRNKNTTVAEYRRASKKLSAILAGEVAGYLERKQIKLETPLMKTTGVSLKNDVMLVPILRSGAVLLPTFLEFFESASVGFVGLRRNEKTAIAELYYHKLPSYCEKTEVLVLDPMIATGGSGAAALRILRDDAGVKEEKIIFSAIIGAKEGINAIKKEFPKIRLLVVQVDPKLNTKKFILPGLGDFGDRYFCTEF